MCCQGTNCSVLSVGPCCWTAQALSLSHSCLVFTVQQGLNTLDNPEAVGRLKYMLLCKIMTSKSDAEEVPAIISSRAGLKYAGDTRFPHHFTFSSMQSSQPCDQSDCHH